MGKIIGVAACFAIVIVAILMFPDMTDSIESADSESFEETFTAVATGAGVTTAICNFTQSLYNGNIQEVTDIESDNTNDFPSAYAYDENEDDLTVKSLAASSSRNLTVTYNVESSGAFTGLSKIFKISPLLIFMSILGVAGLAIWWGFFKGR